MNNERLNGNELAKRLGLTWSHSVIYAEILDSQIYPDKSKRHHQIVLPIIVSDETNYLGLTEKMVRARMVEIVDPLMAVMVMQPETRMTDPEVQAKVMQLQKAQRWTEVWATDNMMEWLGDDETKSQLTQTAYMLSKLDTEVVAKLPDKDPGLEYVLFLASLKRLNLDQDNIIKPLVGDGARFLETIYATKGVEQLNVLADQLAVQIPRMSHNPEAALHEYELITQAMLPVVKAPFAAHLTENKGNHVWVIDNITK